MANLTLSIDDDLLKRARLHALEQDTSVNALVRAYLRDLAGADARHDAVSALLSLAAESDSGSGSAGRTWRRDELYERG